MLPCLRWCMTVSARADRGDRDPPHGRAASPGLAIGPVTILDGRRGQAHGRATLPRRKRRRCRRRSKARQRRLAELIETKQNEVADILEFQVAMLEDDALAEGAYRRRSRWAHLPTTPGASVLDVEIAGYRSAEDEYFRARVADIVDIRDRVLVHLNGADTVRQRSPAARSLRRRHLAFHLSSPPTGRMVVRSCLPRAHRPLMSRCWRARAGPPWSSGSAPCRERAATGAGSGRRRCRHRHLRSRAGDATPVRAAHGGRNAARAVADAGRVTPAYHGRWAADRGPSQHRRTRGSCRASIPRSATASVSCARNSCSRPLKACRTRKPNMRSIGAFSSGRREGR